MKELEKRIAEIEKGELQTLYKEHDYYQLYGEQLSDLDGVSKVAYSLRLENLIKKVNQILERKSIIKNSAIRVFDENWDKKTSNEHSQNYRDFEITEKLQHINEDFDEDTHADIDDGMDFITKFITASPDLVEKVNIKLREELIAMKDVLTHLLGVKSTEISETEYIIEVATKNEGRGKKIGKIREKLAPIKENVSSEDFETLILVLSEYIDTQKFPPMYISEKLTTQFRGKLTT